MLHLRSLTGLSIHLECWNANPKEKLKEIFVHRMWVLWRSSRERPENVLGTSRINLPGTSLEGQIRTSPGRHFRSFPGRQIGMSPGRQIETSPGWSNRTFRGRPGDVLGICSWNWEKLKFIRSFNFTLKKQVFSTSISEISENVSFYFMIGFPWSL